MLNKKEMLLLIEANDNMAELNRVIGKLAAGGQIREDRYGALLRIGELIFENSALYEEDSDEAFARFMRIALNDKMTPEEKYALFMGEKQASPH